MAKETRTGGREATQGVIPGRIALSVGVPDLPEPTGFYWCRLADLARLESGHTPSRSRDDYWGGDIPWIGIRDATGNHGQILDDTHDHVSQAGLDNSSARLLPAGTVCLSRTASVGFVVEMGRPMATSQDFVNWVCGPQLNSRYLRYILQFEQDSVRRFAHGTTHQTMYYPEAKALTVLIPSRPEQDRIANVLSALDDQINANTRVSDAAFELAHLLALKAIQATGAGTSDRVCTKLGDLGDLFDGPHATPTRCAEGPYFLNISSLKSGRLDLSESDHVSESDFSKWTRRVTPRAGDLLFSYETRLGEAALMPEGVRACLGRRMALLRPDRNRVDPHFLLHFYLSPAFQRMIAERTIHGATVPRIGLATMGDWKIEVPPMHEQEAIAGSLRALHEAMVQAERESVRLATVRDELLPLLISGKVRVTDAEAVGSEGL
jgi:type I restriction enzyme, S subunit